MNSITASRVRRTGLKVGFGLAIVASLSAVYAFKTIFARPGEAALRFVPADALVVGAIDLNPSPQQALAFKRIDDAMDRNGMNRFLESSILDMFGRNPGMDPLRPMVLRNGAFALLPEGDKGNHIGLMMLALTSGTDATGILIKFGKPAFFRGTKYYTFKSVDANFMVMDDLLVIGEKPMSLHMARMVHDGQAPSITTVAAFTEARARLAGDANVMAFCNPKMLGQADVSALKGASASWLAAGLAIRDGGIGLSVWNQFDPATVKGLAEFGKTKEVRRDLFQVLPSGAYGVVALSQPANMFDQFEAVASQEKDGSKMISEMGSAMRENVGLDLKQDVLTGLRGNAVVAAYPSVEKAGVDLLMVLDDSNGSDPAAAVKRFQSYVEEQMAKEGDQPPLWVKTDSGFRVSDEMEKEMREGLGEGMDPATVRKDALVDKKTIAWAVVDKTVIAASSQELLDRAVASYRTHGANLAADAEFLKSDAEVLDGSQVMAVFNLGRIAAGVGNTVKTDKMGKEDGDMFRTITGAFEKLVDPFYVKARVGADGQVSTGAFIPIDYDKVFDFIGSEMKKNGK